MQQRFEEIKVKTNGQGLYNFTESTLDWLGKQKIECSPKTGPEQYSLYCPIFFEYFTLNVVIFTDSNDFIFFKIYISSYITCMLCFFK